MKTTLRLPAATLALAMMILSGAAHAEMSFSLSSNYYGDVKLGDGSEAGLVSFGAEAAWTQVKDQGATIFEHGLSGTMHVFDGLELEDRVGEASYRFTWIRNPSPERTWVYVLQPTIASSFEADLGMDDFNLTAAVLRLTNRSPNYTWGWGLAYTMQFGTPFPVPILKIAWNDGGRWSLDALLPSHVVLDRHLGGGWRTGLGMTVSGGQYRLDPAAHPVDNPQLQRVEVVVGPHLTLSTESGGELSLRGGWAIHRELLLKDGADDYIDYEPETGPTIGLTARLGF